MGTGVFAWFSWPPSARDGLGESESDRVLEVRIGANQVCLSHSVSCVSRIGSHRTDTSNTGAAWTAIGANPPR